MDENGAIFWLELREPDCVPERKGPFKQDKTFAATMREFMDARPDAFITVVTFDCYGRPEFQDGPEALEIADGRSRSRAQRHREGSRAAFRDWKDAPRGAASIEIRAADGRLLSVFDL